MYIVSSFLYWKALGGGQHWHDAAAGLLISMSRGSRLSPVQSTRDLYPVICFLYDLLAAT
jgi:hypothetical protein